MCDAIAECGKRHTALSGRCRSGDLPAFPAPAHRAKVLRERLGGATKPDAPCFGCRDSFRLPLADGFPLRLRHVAKKLQHQIGDQRPGEIPCLARIQKRHIQHNNGSLLFFGDASPLLEDLLVIPPQTVDALYYESIAALQPSKQPFVVFPRKVLPGLLIRVKSRFLNAVLLHSNHLPLLVLLSC